jgi:hypothetical protein
MVPTNEKKLVEKQPLSSGYAINIQNAPAPANDLCGEAVDLGTLLAGETEAFRELPLVRPVMNLIASGTSTLLEAGIGCSWAGPVT